MNYNANIGSRPNLGKKIKRVSDVNAMGYQPYSQQQSPPPPPPSAFPTGSPNINSQPVGYPAGQPRYANDNFVPNIPQTPNMSVGTPYMGQPQPQMNPALFAQPIVQDMAYQYGQQLASTGTTLVKQNIDKYVPVSKLKYYFAVDTKYVASKLKLLFFPYLHSDWALKYEQDGSPVQPRFEINAPDLYIPTMAYVTYVLVAGIVLGMQQRFSPEQIGILASSALAWCIVELVIYSCTLYIVHIETTLRTFDLLAFSGYKFVAIIASILATLAAGTTGYYVTLTYTTFSLAFFLIRTLRVQVLSETSTQQSQYYGSNYPTVGNKRRLYFLLFVAGLQPILSWWLSFHLLAKELKAPDILKSS
ncbi:protein YIF1B-B [Agrilus planipennis]|uniref:Protein YIF1 n=1 Tax=Agrilus planipennis TaxID=224129 RepID=A0A1W4XRD5_AGRPL|nr:protein YIF1B-B [Agrilus planipennis]